LIGWAPILFDALLTGGIIWVILILPIAILLGFNFRD
jgi:hypothetical protein